LYTVYLSPPRLARIHNFSKSNFLRVSSRHLYLKFNLLAAGQTEKRQETQKRRVSLTTEYAQSGIGPVSGVHSIMMEKLAQPGEGGGAHPPPFTMSTITYKVVVYAPAVRADTLTLFLLYTNIYSVGLTWPLTILF
jgi:hypothetical protein